MIQQQNLHFVVDIDIKGFFDNVNHSKLIRQIWAMGIRDKKLICVIKQMLKAPVIMPDGSKVYPTRGTPQGGILSPLLANIVLNELDWWISSQWESIPTHTQYKLQINRSGTVCVSDKYRALRKSNLKEIYIVRYADDFKIFCRKHSDADKIFIAVKKWLKKRLKLDVSEEKSKVVNLKKEKSEFLGFELKAVKKNKKFVVRSHISPKAMNRITESLRKQVKKIHRTSDSRARVMEVNYYNSMIVGIHNYYRYATHVSCDCGYIQHRLHNFTYNQLKQFIRKSGVIQRKYIAENYSRSKLIIYINGYPMIPIGYIQTKFPKYKNVKICKYTSKGREEIHKTLKFDESVITVMHLLAKSYSLGRSIEYTDNRVSLYAAQYGKCYITGEMLWIDEVHCHHKKPISQGGTDEYKNLVIVHEYVHKLIHATNQEIITAYLSKLNLNQSQIQKFNKLRIMAGNPAI